MPYTIDKCELFGIKYFTLLEGETFLRNKHKIEFFLHKRHIFLVEKKTPLINFLNTYSTFQSVL